MSTIVVNPHITDAEWEVMRVVWVNGRVTSKEVISILKEKMDWKQATLKTLLGRLVEKGVLNTEQEGRYSSCDGSLVYFWRTIDESNVCGSRHEFQLRIGLAQCFTVKTIQTSSCLENT